MTSEQADYAVLFEALKKKKVWRKNRLLSIPALQANPLAAVIVGKYTQRARVDMERLLGDLLDFLTSKRLEDKLKFVFECYDINGDGYISNKDLYDLLTLINRGILPNEAVQNIVDKTFAAVGEYALRINYHDFKVLLLASSDNLIEMFNCTE
ncbi:serine/threonine-protein phosphatase 2B regulatory subunit [Pancytospora philotis]|nr:serine/threonine-protein phosphatase 2B regulatory subunit [Pancytospora philotis]